MPCTPLPDGTGYVCEIEYCRWHEDAARRHRRGERQVQCRTCGRWYWADEFKQHKCQEVQGE